MSLFLMAQHSVADYKKWREIFNSFEEMRIDHGMHNPIVLRNMDNPSETTIVFEIDDIQKAKTFLDSKLIRDAILSAGVTSVPDFTFFKKV